MDERRERVRRLVSWSRGKPAGPYKIDLEPAFGCNLRCVFCWQRTSGRIDRDYYRRRLGLKRMLRLVDEAKELDVRQWQLAGGWEPSFRLHTTMSVARRIKALDMHGSITTNLTGFTEPSLKELVSIGWDEILVSMEGPDAAIHDRLVGKKGAFDRVEKLLRFLADTKSDCEAGSPKVAFHSVLTNLNAPVIDRMLELAHGLDVDGLNFEPITAWNEAGRRLRLDADEMRRLQKDLPRLEELAHTLEVHTNVGTFRDRAILDKRCLRARAREDVSAMRNARSGVESKIRNPNLRIALTCAFCFEPWLGCEVRVVGHVVPCRVYDLKTGPYLQEMTLRDIWFGAHFDSVRRSILSGRVPSYCNGCASGLMAENTRLREALGLAMRRTTKD